MIWKDFDISVRSRYLSWMHREYALNYPQLMNQAIAAGYGENDLRRLKSAHDLAMRLVDGYYRGQGVPFLNHLVRTASIVIAEKGPLDAVMAALLHSAYYFGQFLDGKQGGRSQAHQKEMISFIGEAAEQLVSLYNSTDFRKPVVLKQHLEKATGYSEDMKKVLLISLANELEDFLDLGMPFRGAYPYRENLERDGKLILAIAERAGYPQLVSELDEAFRATLASALPAPALTGSKDAFELPAHRDYRRGPLKTTLARVKRKILEKRS